MMDTFRAWIFNFFLFCFRGGLGGFGSLFLVEFIVFIIEEFKPTGQGKGGEKSRFDLVGHHHHPRSEIFS